MPKKPRSRDSLIHTARSLLALSQRGEANENDSARAKFEKFMQRHHLSGADLGVGHVRQFTFEVEQESQWLFMQVAAKVLGDVAFAKAEGGVGLVVPCAEEDVPRLWAMFDRYQRIYRQEEQLLRSAFIEVNELWPRADMLHTPPVNAPRTTTPTPPPPPAEETPADEAPENTETTPQMDTASPMVDPEALPPHIDRLRVEGMRQLLRKVPFHLPIGNGDAIPATDHAAPR